jgi:predicted dehydrogenase
MAARAIRRIGLIGAGKHGARYARHIRFDFPDLELAAIVRRNREQGAALAGELGARLFTDYRELIERGGVDAVIVVVPPTLHLDVVTCAARAGIPVLLEKPAAPSLAIGRELLAVLAAHPIPLMVAQTLRFNSVVRALAAACESIAPLRALAFTQRFEPSPLSWLDDPAQAGGGIVLHTGVHAFDLIRLFTGLEPDAVTCQTAAVRTRRTEDSFVAGVRLGGGSVLATVSCSRVAGARSGHIELTGERGMLVGDHVLHHAARVIGTAAEPLSLADPLPTVREVVRTFVGALRAGTPLPITLVDGLRAVALAEACYAAARSGQVTAVESVDDGPAAARGAA